ncbi:MAG: sigma-70 family RNA polymerase sigma factor [Planctomycetales bacterium]|nr:sigma-70 family RNA polymerase sigma factor [Planctomycetales bacterium]
MSSSSADSGDQHPDPRPDQSYGDLDGSGVDDTTPGVDSSDQATQQPTTWREVFEQSESGLRRFLAGKLPQDADVDDCLQSVLVAMLKNETKIPAAARRAWLYRVAGNEAARWWRHKSTTDRVLEKHAETVYGVDTVVPANIETKETLDQINRAINNLDENSRQIVNLRLRDGMTFQQIADQLNLPLGTVLTRMRRSMQKLRNEIDGDKD